MKVDHLESCFSEIRDSLYSDENKGRASFPAFDSKSKDINPSLLAEISLAKKEHEERITFLEEHFAKFDNRVELLQEGIHSIGSSEKINSSPVNLGVQEIETLLTNTEIMQKYTIELKEEIQEIKKSQLTDKENFLTALEKGKVDIQGRFIEQEILIRTTNSKMNELDDESQKKKIKISELDNEVKSLKYKTYNLEQNYDEFTKSFKTYKESFESNIKKFDDIIETQSMRIDEIFKFILLLMPAKLR